MERGHSPAAFASVLVLALLLTFVVQRTGPVFRVRPAPETQSLAVIDRWSDESRQTAHLMIERYGAPENILADRLEWQGRWPWKRVIVHGRGLPLEEVVSHPVPADKLGALAGFGHGISADSRRAELSARSSKEDLNRLALNLADDVINGRRTPAEAGRVFFKLSELTLSGKSTPYSQVLLFEVPAETR